MSGLNRCSSFGRRVPFFVGPAPRLGEQRDTGRTNREVRRIAHMADLRRDCYAVFTEEIHSTVHTTRGADYLAFALAGAFSAALLSARA